MVNTLDVYWSMYIDMYISAQQISYRFYVLEKLGVRKNDFFLNSLEIDFEKKKPKDFPSN